MPLQWTPYHKMECAFNITMTDTAYRESIRGNVCPVSVDVTSRLSCSNLHQGVKVELGIWGRSSIPSRTKQIDAVWRPCGKVGVNAYKNQPE